MYGSQLYGSILYGGMGASADTLVQPAKLTVALTLLPATVPDDVFFASLLSASVTVLAPAVRIDQIAEPAVLSLSGSVLAPVIITDTAFAPAQPLRMTLSSRIVSVITPSYIAFERTEEPVGSVMIRRVPDYRNIRKIDRHLVPSNRTTDRLLQYTRSRASFRFLEITFSNISYADMCDFQQFVELVSNGAANEFYFTDTNGDRSIAIFWNPTDLATDPVCTGQESLTIELLLDVQDHG